MVAGDSLKHDLLSDLDCQRIYASYPDARKGPDKFCPTCYTEKQYRLNGQMHDCDCVLQLQLFKHYLNAGIGVHYQRLRWEDLEINKEIGEKAIDYLERHRYMIGKGVSLIFSGDYGTGKTLLATLVLKELVKFRYTCFSTTFSSMVAMYTAGWNSAEEQRFFQKKVKHSQVLLLDDLGKEMRTKTNLAESIFDDVVRTRIQHGHPTFLTTNIPLTELESGYGGAVFSLLKEVGTSYTFVGADFRPKVNERHKSESELGETRPIY